jgi:hypothetical protein
LHRNANRRLAKFLNFERIFDFLDKNRHIFLKNRPQMQAITSIWVHLRDFFGLAGCELA